MVGKESGALRVLIAARSNRAAFPVEMGEP